MKYQATIYFDLSESPEIFETDDLGAFREKFNAYQNDPDRASIVELTIGGVFLGYFDYKPFIKAITVADAIYKPEVN